MLLGVFGDIHGNYEALASIYEKLEDHGCERIICLGDVVGYGASPGRCIDFLRYRDIECIKGNHDFFALDHAASRDWEMQDYGRDAILWTQKQLSMEQFAWLESLPFSLCVDGIQFVHASMETVDGEYWPYILDAKTAQFHFYLQESQVAFCGHLHIPLLFSCSGEGGIKMEMLKTKVLDLTSGDKFLISPGAAGQPRDLDWRASAVCYDTLTGLVEPVRAEYNVEASKEKIFAAGLSEDLAERLSRGV
ncbi:MAG: metallophosphoesterase family protein [Victivallales bacterium]|nr:metallophosphoesterase family protein [Victivallales bacterium]